MSVAARPERVPKDVNTVTDAESFAAAFEYENKHRDFSRCQGCGAVTWQQHAFDCRRSTILVRPDWYEEIQRRDANREEA